MGLMVIMGLSIRAYARHRGVSHVAVKKAIDSGRITPEPDGTIEPVSYTHLDVYKRQS